MSKNSNLINTFQLGKKKKKTLILSKNHILMLCYIKIYYNQNKKLRYNLKYFEV